MQISKSLPDFRTVQGAQAHDAARVAASKIGSKESISKATTLFKTTGKRKHSPIRNPLIMQQPRLKPGATTPANYETIWTLLSKMGESFSTNAVTEGGIINMIDMVNQHLTAALHKLNALESEAASIQARISKAEKNGEYAGWAMTGLGLVVSVVVGGMIGGPVGLIGAVLVGSAGLVCSDQIKMGGLPITNFVLGEAHINFLGKESLYGHLSDVIYTDVLRSPAGKSGKGADEWKGWIQLGVGVVVGIALGIGVTIASLGISAITQLPTLIAGLITGGEEDVIDVAGDAIDEALEAVEEVATAAVEAVEAAAVDGVEAIEKAAEDGVEAIAQAAVDEVELLAKLGLKGAAAVWEAAAYGADDVEDAAETAIYQIVQQAAEELESISSEAVESVAEEAEEATESLAQEATEATESLAEEATEATESVAEEATEAATQTASSMMRDLTSDVAGEATSDTAGELSEETLEAVNKLEEAASEVVENGPQSLIKQIVKALEKAASGGKAVLSTGKTGLKYAEPYLRGVMTAINTTNSMTENMKTKDAKGTASDPLEKILIGAGCSEKLAGYITMAINAVVSVATMAGGGLLGIAGTGSSFQILMKGLQFLGMIEPLGNGIVMGVQSYVNGSMWRLNEELAPAQRGIGAQQGIVAMLDKERKIGTDTLKLLPTGYGLQMDAFKSMLQGANQIAQETSAA